MAPMALLLIAVISAVYPYRGYKSAASMRASLSVWVILPAEVNDLPREVNNYGMAKSGSVYSYMAMYKDI
jgi:hypothetical protein